jgi:hypothetical protein
MMTSRNPKEMRITLALLMLFRCSLACSAPMDTLSREWTPGAPLIAQVESQLRMPAGATLNGYTRYYYGTMNKAHRILVGVFVREDKHPGIEITSKAKAKAPKMLDGGCGVVNLTYDIDQKRVVAIFCNGDA